MNRFVLFASAASLSIRAFANQPAAEPPAATEEGAPVPSDEVPLE